MSHLKRLIVEAHQRLPWHALLIYTASVLVCYDSTDKRGIRMKTHRAGIVLIMAALVGACGGAESRWAGTMSDSAGVTIVSNPAEGMWTEADLWTLEEELRIGAREGDPEYQFGEVNAIAVDSRDRIFVLDRHSQHIKVYSPDGIYEQTVGRRGGGPGELQRATAILITSGDTLLVPDVLNLRFNRYAPDGSPVGSVRMVLEEGHTGQYKVTVSGVIAHKLRPFAATPADVIENPMDAIVLLASDGTVTDTLTTFPADQMFGPGARAENRFYYPETTWDLTESMQVVLGVSDEYRIRLYSNGQLERIIAKPFERESVGDSEKEALRNLQERWWAQAGLSAEIRERIRNRTRINEFYPAFQRVAAGPAGTIWAQHVQRIPDLSDEEDFDPENGAREWDVFDAQGRFLGAVTMPQRFTPNLFRGDKIYGVWRDEFDVEYVVRVRVVGDLGFGAT